MGLATDTDTVGELGLAEDWTAEEAGRETTDEEIGRTEDDTTLLEEDTAAEVGRAEEVGTAEEEARIGEEVTAVVGRAEDEVIADEDRGEVEATTEEEGRTEEEAVTGLAPDDLSKSALSRIPVPDGLPR